MPCASPAAGCVFVNRPLHECGEGLEGDAGAQPLPLSRLDRGRVHLQHSHQSDTCCCSPVVTLLPRQHTAATAPPVCRFVHDGASKGSTPCRIRGTASSDHSSSLESVHSPSCPQVLPPLTALPSTLRFTASSTPGCSSGSEVTAAADPAAGAAAARVLPAAPPASVLRRCTAADPLRDISSLLSRLIPSRCCCCCWAVGDAKALLRPLPNCLEGLLPSSGFPGGSWMMSVCWEAGEEGLWPSGSRAQSFWVPRRFQKPHLQAPAAAAAWQAVSCAHGNDTMHRAKTKAASAGLQHTIHLPQTGTHTLCI